jgi:ACS family tartrate transporter-like MFS transporter
MSNEIDTRPEPIEARTIRKVRIRILPFLFLVYIICFLDRINIGFAALTMNKELAITSQQFGLLAGIFFFGYFLFGVPSNLLLHKVGARIWIACILITWGIVAMLTGFAHNVHQLYVVRFLLGLAEAGYYPGIVLYLTGLPVASILGAPVSGLILDHVHWLGVSSWRWLLILEAVPAVVCGVLTYFLLPSRPAEAKFLARDEKDWIIAELAREHEKKSGQYQMSVAKTFTHLRVWHLASIQFTFLIGLYSLSFWMPLVIKSLSSHYSNTVVGFLAVLPQLAGLAAMVLVSRSSDQRLERRYHAAIAALAGGMGWLLLGTTTSPVVSMLLLSLVAAGAYSIAGPFWSLPSEFLTGYAAASGIAFINSLGNLGGFAGPYAVGLIKDKTGSLHWGFALVGISMLVSAMFLMLLPKKCRVQIG